MTPFMLRVSELLDLVGDLDLPETRPSVPTPIPIGAEHHVEYRSLAEQLVSEANAVLASTGERLALADDLGEGELAFCISYGDRLARVSTNIGAAVATGHLQGVGAGGRADVELTGPEQIERLILLVIGGDSAADDVVVPVPGTTSA